MFNTTTQDDISSDDGIVIASPAEKAAARRRMMPPSCGFCLRCLMCHRRLATRSAILAIPAWRDVIAARARSLVQ